MSHVRIWVHAVWGTKNRLPYFAGPVKHEVSATFVTMQMKKVYICLMGFISMYIVSLVVCRRIAVVAGAIEFRISK
jgi:hypothetical protein